MRVTSDVGRTAHTSSDDNLLAGGRCMLVLPCSGPSSDVLEVQLPTRDQHPMYQRIL
jgi:hypothetical protein